jgi:hypothetical protein
MNIYNEYQDQVIKSKVLIADLTYTEALEQLYPLVNRFEAQRKILDTKFYKRLERDILKGCMMPPVTIAFVNPDLEKEKDIKEYVISNIDRAYILDGIQRLNTLERARYQEGFDGKKYLLLNVIIAPTKDMLLYRMITLNNGQKPMTPRHQIEILTHELFDFSELNIDVQTEKGRSERVIRGAFNMGDISRGYLAFLTDKVNNENTKIIGEKMDQILVGRILDSNVTDSSVEFEEVLEVIDLLASNNDTIKKWLKTSNNLIGFCVGIKHNFDIIKGATQEEFNLQILKFEEAFKAINPSKVNLGKFRRNLSKYFIENYTEILDMDSSELIERFADITV